MLCVKPPTSLFCWYKQLQYHWLHCWLKSSFMVFKLVTLKSFYFSAWAQANLLSLVYYISFVLMQLFVIDYWISSYKSLTVFSWEKIAQVDAKAIWVLMVISLWYLSYRMTGKKSFKHGTWMIVMRIRDFPITASQRNLYLSTNLLVYMLKSYHNFFFSLKLFGFRHGLKLIMPSFLSPLVT